MSLFGLSRDPRLYPPISPEEQTTSSQEARVRHLAAQLKFDPEVCLPPLRKSDADVFIKELESMVAEHNNENQDDDEAGMAREIPKIISES